METNGSSIGERIRAERTRRAMTLGALARRAGIAESNLSLIENGKTDPRWSTIVRIFTALGLDPSAAVGVRRAAGSDPWERLRRKAERGDDVRDEAFALAANTARRAKRGA